MPGHNKGRARSNTLALETNNPSGPAYAPNLSLWHEPALPSLSRVSGLAEKFGKKPDQLAQTVSPFLIQTLASPPSNPN
ncbi:hypothetical protein J6590_015805 [Homalodisca vitripennis]|nr:hypothetical protein J6590_015805 [Homalodisca vitripennis]